MAIPHAQPEELVDPSPLAEKLPHTQATTLAKTGSLDVLRLVLPAGKKIDPHSVPGENTVQCLEGTVEFDARVQRRILKSSAFLYLSGGHEHSVRAIEDSSLLVTILLRPT